MRSVRRVTNDSPVSEERARSLHRESAMLLTLRHALVCWIAAVAAVLLAACGSGGKTSVTQMWKAPVSTPPVSSVIVIAANLDEANRRALEDAYVAALAQHGLKAKQSYTMLPGEPPPRDQAREIVKSAGFDGILVSRLRSATEKQTYVPGTYEGGFWEGYYGGPGWGTWSPGYVITDEVVSFDTTLWDTRKGDQLVFALTTETTNPASNKNFIPSLTKTVVSALQKQMLIPPTKQQ
jgi:hypothetical protein